MLWGNFLDILKEAEQRFNQIIDDLPQYQIFLKKSSLIISFGTIHIPFKNELTVLDLKSILELLKDSDYKNNLLCLNDLLERLEDDQKAMVKQKRNEALKEIIEKIRRVKDELNTFPLKELEVDDGIDIQLIFPSVNIEAIQAVKEHPLTNKEKTCLCRACIRCFLF